MFSYARKFFTNPSEYTLSEQGRYNADCCDHGDDITSLDAMAIQMVESHLINASNFPIKSSDLIK